MSGLLVIDRIEVSERSLEARVRVSDPDKAKTSAFPGLADRIVSLLPGLARHSCDNSDGLDFVRELRDTELAHCVEHVAVELMALAGSPRTLRAQTSWDFSADGRGVYRIQLAFDDDLVALGALRESVALVEWAAGDRAETPDVNAIANHLRTLRAVPGA